MSIKTRLSKLEEIHNPAVMEVTIIRFTGNEPLPAPAIIGNTMVRYKYADDVGDRLMTD